MAGTVIVTRENEDKIYNKYYLTIRPVAPKGYVSIAHEAKPNGLLTRGH